MIDSRIFLFCQRLLDVGAFDDCPVGGLCPVDSVPDDLDDIGLIVDGEGLVAGLEVEDTAVAAAPAAGKEAERAFA
jgi:hypothetical protein